jgi:NAD(P)-dependent dehydrogenase (short-subunit alcohol dehydrogenase family)
MALPGKTGVKTIAGKSVVVTGASSGLGRGLALEFARAGAAKVAMIDVDEEGLAGTKVLVEAQGARATTRRVDVSVYSQMEEFASGLLAEWGAVDILVNNAGVGVGGELKDVDVRDFDWIVGINLMGEVYGTRLFLPQMIERGSGHIVNIASLSGLVLLPFHLPYTTTKFGLAGFSEALWAEARRFGVGVTLVCPGAIKTSILQNTRITAQLDGQRKFVERFQAQLEEKGMEPEDVARLVIKAVERDRFLLLTGPESYVMYYLRRLAPGMMRRLAALITDIASR